MPKLIRFVVVNSAIGILIGWAVAIALFALNINGLGEMFFKLETGNQFALAGLMAIMFGSTFGFGYLATAVWMIPTDKGEFDKL